MRKIGESVTLPFYLLAFIEIFIGATVALLGVIVMFGWHSGRLNLVRGFADNDFTAYNAAFCFTLCGAALLLHAGNFRRIGLLVSFLICLVGLLTVAEYAANRSFGIDQIFTFLPANSETGDYSGRMALNSALCFVLCGAAFGLLFSGFNLARAVAASLGAVIFDLGAVALIGYSLDVPAAHTWGKFSQMTTLTAVGLMFAGLGVAVAAWNRESRRKLRPPRWMPVMIVCWGLTITFCLSLAYSVQEGKSADLALQAVSSEAQNAIQNKIKERAAILSEMSERWKNQGGTPREHWEADAARIVADFSGFQGIEWVDPSFHVRWVAPLAGNEAVINMNLAAESKRRAALEVSRDRRAITVTQIVELVQGGRGILIYSPLYKGDDFDGFIIGIVRLDTFIGDILPASLKDNYTVTVFEQGQKVYESGAIEEPELFAEQTAILPNAQWTVRLNPKTPTADKLKSATAESVLGFGLFASVLLASTFYFLQKSRREIRRNTLSNRRLQREIAARRILENQLLEARDAALESARQKSSFLANMSHEIRTPMNGVVGSTELLAETALSAKQIEYVRTIQTSGDLLLAIINDILDLSKIEENKLTLETVNFDLRETLRETVNLFAPIAAQKGIRLETYFEPSAETALRGDERRLRQILINLIGNACKFTETGKITVHIGSHSTEKEKLRVGFTVTDTGIGISEEVQTALFEPFTQADSSTTRKYGGTGLGLAICRRLVELMNGTIGIRSVLGSGSSFWFTAEFERPAPEISAAYFQTSLALPSPRSSSSENQKIYLAGDAPRVLIVEDNLTNQMVTKRQVERLGWRVEIAADGQKALDKLASASFDIILMDCQMPVMDGYAATREIRRREQAKGARRTPIIALTASAMSDDEQKCFAAGMDDYLSKPVRREKLTKVFDRWLKKVGSGDDTAGSGAAFGYASSPASKPNAAKISDEMEKRLNVLAEECGFDAVRQIARIFLDDMLKKIVLLRRMARQTENFPQVAREAHALKGACLNFGANEMADLGRQIERAARAVDSEAVLRAVEKLAFEFESVHEKLELALLNEAADKTSAFAAVSESNEIEIVT